MDTPLKLSTLHTPAPEQQLETTGDRENNPKSQLFQRGRVIVMEIGTRTKKGRHHVKLLRHKKFETIRKTS